MSSTEKAAGAAMIALAIVIIAVAAWLYLAFSKGEGVGAPRAPEPAGAVVPPPEVARLQTLEVRMADIEKNAQDQ